MSWNADPPTATGRRTKSGRHERIIERNKHEYRGIRIMTKVCKTFLHGYIISNAVWTTQSNVNGMILGSATLLPLLNVTLVTVSNAPCCAR